MKKLNSKLDGPLTVIFSITLMVMFLDSCITNKKITYLQEVSDSNYSTIDTSDHLYRVQPSDNLYIRVITPDPKWASRGGGRRTDRPVG